MEIFGVMSTLSATSDYYDLFCLVFFVCFLVVVFLVLNLFLFHAKKTSRLKKKKKGSGCILLSWL